MYLIHTAAPSYAGKLNDGKVVPCGCHIQASSQIE
jgi:hypothetical protein